MLYRKGHSFGLPERSKPQTSLGRTPGGSPSLQSTGGGETPTGSHRALFQAGSSAESFPSALAFERSQYSTRSSPDQPTIAVPWTVIASPALTDAALRSLK